LSTPTIDAAELRRSGQRPGLRRRQPCVAAPARQRPQARGEEAHSRSDPGSQPSQGPEGLQKEIAVAAETMRSIGPEAVFQAKDEREG
jgi:hypothetical protein